MGDDLFTFYMQVCGDEALAEASLSRLRRHYPAARLVLCSDGGDPLALSVLGEQFAAEMHAGKALYGVENGGKLWQRIFDLYLKKPTAFLVKIDPDTRIDRTFTQMPPSDSVSGSRLASGFIQGGCIIIPERVAQRLSAPGILYGDPMKHWASYFSVTKPTWFTPPGPPRIHTDWLLHRACQTLGIPTKAHPEIASEWMELRDNTHQAYAALHPDKFLHHSGALRSLLLRQHQAVCTILAKAIAKPATPLVCNATFNADIFVGYTGNTGDALMYRAVEQHFPHARCTYNAGPVQDSDILFDASGNFFGAPWGQKRLHMLAEAMPGWRQQNKRVIFLPQSFGPFSPEEEILMERILQHADRVYAREESSLEHLYPLSRGHTPVRVAPDFSIDVPGMLPAEWYPQGRPIAIVPNMRMLDQTLPAIAESYVPFLLEVIRASRDYGLTPFLLVHEERDEPLCRAIQERCHSPIALVQPKDAQVTKGIIGACEALVGSRYHALINALSQGVPALATRWHHKYDALYSLYACPEYLIDLPSSPEQIAEAVDLLCAEARRLPLLTRIHHGIQKHHQEVGNMWREVDAVVAEISTPA